MDVKIVFLYGLIDQLVYIDILKGSKIEVNRNMIYKLFKALYSLKQSPQLWYKKLLTFLIRKLGLSQINVDHSIFVTKTGLNSLVVSTFVDDIKIMAPKENGITQRVKAELTTAFLMADMGFISFYLGLKVERDQVKQTIKFSQPIYIDKVLAKFHFDKTHAINTLMKKTALFQPRTEGQAILFERE